MFWLTESWAKSSPVWGPELQEDHEDAQGHVPTFLPTLCGIDLFLGFVCGQLPVIPRTWNCLLTRGWVSWRHSHLIVCKAWTSWCLLREGMPGRQALLGGKKNRELTLMLQCDATVILFWECLTKEKECPETPWSGRIIVVSCLCASACHCVTVTHLSRPNSERSLPVLCFPPLLPASVPPCLLSSFHHRFCCPRLLVCLRLSLSLNTVPGKQQAFRTQKLNEIKWMTYHELPFSVFPDFHPERNN